MNESASTSHFSGLSEGPESGGERRQTEASGVRASLPERIRQFLSDVRAEMKRVSWPTTDEVKNTTIVTLIAVVFFATYLYAVDRGLTLLITQLERLVNWLVGAA